MEVKQSRTAEETINRRMRNSGGEEADKTIKSGNGSVASITTFTCMVIKLNTARTTLVNQGSTVQ